MPFPSRPAVLPGEDSCNAGWGRARGDATAVSRQHLNPCDSAVGCKPNRGQAQGKVWTRKSSQEATKLPGARARASDQPVDASLEVCEKGATDARLSSKASWLGKSLNFGQM